MSRGDSAPSNADQGLVQGMSFRASFRSGAYLGGARAFYLATRIAYIVVLVSLIGVEAYGYLSYSQNWYVLVIPLAALGSGEVALRYLARAPAKDRDSLMRSGLALRLLLGLAGVALVWIAAWFVEDDPRLRALMLIYSQGVLVRSLGAWFIALFTAFSANRFWLRLSIAFTTLEIAVTLLLAANGAGLLILAAAHCAIWWLSLGATAWVFHQYISPLALAWDPVAVRLLIFRGAAIGVATFFLGCLLPGLLVAFRLLTGELHKIGEVAIVLQILQVCLQAVLFVSSAALPALSRPGEQDRGQQAFLRFNWNATFYLGGAVVLCTTFVIPAALTLLPETRFDPSLVSFANCSWVILPLFLLHGFRLVVIARDLVLRLPLIMASGVATSIALVALMAKVQLLTSDGLYLALGLGLVQIALCLGVSCGLRLRPRLETSVAPLLLVTALALASATPGDMQWPVALSAAALLSILGALEIRRLAVS